MFRLIAASVALMGIVVGAWAGPVDEGSAEAAAPAEHPNRELLDRIRQKLDQINRMMQQRARPVPVPPKAVAPQPAEAPRPEPAPDPPPAQEEQPAPAPKLPEPSTEQQVVPETPAPNRDMEDGIESIPLLEKPVDLIRAARALLKSGQYRDALRLYQAIPREVVQGDEWHWILYEQALCLKRLGNLDAAARLYREIAASASDPELREACRWQLDSLQWRRRVQQTVQALSQQEATGERQQ